MSTPRVHHYTGHYLAVFTSNKTSPKWRAWYAMTDAERAATDVKGLAALKAWDEAHKADIVYQGGPLGPTKRTLNELSVVLFLIGGAGILVAAAAGTAAASTPAVPWFPAARRRRRRTASRACRRSRSSRKSAPSAAASP